VPRVGCIRTLELGDNSQVPYHSATAGGQHVHTTVNRCGSDFSDAAAIRWTTAAITKGKFVESVEIDGDKICSATGELTDMFLIFLLLFFYLFTIVCFQMFKQGILNGEVSLYH